jgi:hypothetical protein
LAAKNAYTQPMDVSPPNRLLAARKKDAQKSRIANGSVLVSGVDGRSAWVRRLKETLAELRSDIPDASAAERSLIRRASTLTVELEQLEARFAVAGQASTDDLDLYQRCASSLRRLLESVGLERRARPVPNLSEYIASLPKTLEDTT